MGNSREYLWRQDKYSKIRTLNNTLFDEGDKKDEFTLLIEEENDCMQWLADTCARRDNVKDKPIIRSRWYFHDIQQFYNGGMIYENYGYRPFREANPDLNDVHGTGHAEESAHNKPLVEELKLLKVKADKWDEKWKKLSMKEQMEVKQEDNPHNRLKYIDKYNVKKNGWACCITHMPHYVYVIIDIKDEALLERPYRISQEELDNLIKLAPFTKKWSEFGIPNGNHPHKGLAKSLEWVDKKDLPGKAYLSTSIKYKRYKDKLKTKKKMGVK